MKTIIKIPKEVFDRSKKEELEEAFENIRIISAKPEEYFKMIDCGNNVVIPYRVVDNFDSKNKDLLIKKYRVIANDYTEEFICSRN